MAFNKTLRSEAEVVIVGGGQKDLFPIGFEYMANGHVYKVVNRFFQDNTEWRRLRDDSGTLEDVTIATILEDLDTGRPITKKGVMKAYKPERDAKPQIVRDPYSESQKEAEKQQEVVEETQPEVVEEPVEVVKPKMIKKIKSKTAKVKAASKKPKKR